jgi:hypothetical protein
MNGTIEKIGQSAGNIMFYPRIGGEVLSRELHKIKMMFMENNRSSETLREVTFFQFSEFHQSNTFKAQPQSFYEWFVGFAEGDGSFITSSGKDLRQPNLKSRKRLYFYLVQKNPSVLYMIKKKFGFGQVQKHGSEAYRWSVTKDEHLRLLCLLAKDNVVLRHRQEQLAAWCDFFGLQQNIQTEWPPLLTTGWLSGFIDAEGCFYIYMDKDKRYKRPQFKYRFILDQKNGFPLFEHIRNTFEGTFYCRKGTKNVFRYVAQSKIIFRTKLLPYLRRFPCFTEKRIAVFRWHRDLILNSKKS